MPVDFCLNCGMPNTYSSIKPKECKKCKHPFAAPTLNQAEKNTYIRPVPNRDVDMDNVLTRESAPNDYIMMADEDKVAACQQALARLKIKPMSEDEIQLFKSDDVVVLSDVLKQAQANMSVNQPTQAAPIKNRKVGRPPLR